MEKNRAFLDKLVRASPAKRKKIVAQATHAQLRVLVEVVASVVFNQVPISASEKAKLLRSDKRTKLRSVFPKTRAALKRLLQSKSFAALRRYLLPLVPALGAVFSAFYHTVAATG